MQYDIHLGIEPLKFEDFIDICKSTHYNWDESKEKQIIEPFLDYHVVNSRYSEQISTHNFYSDQTRFFNVVLGNNNAGDRSPYKILWFRCREYEKNDRRSGLIIQQIWFKEHDPIRKLYDDFYTELSVGDKKFISVNKFSGELIYHESLKNTPLRAYTTFFEESNVIYLTNIDDWLKFNFKQIFEYPKGRVLGENNSFYYAFPFYSAMDTREKSDFYKSLVEPKLKHGGKAVKGMSGPKTMINNGNMIIKYCFDRRVGPDNWRTYHEKIEIPLEDIRGLAEGTINE